ncbi:hypothetical protein Tco_1291352 [Tanacetum coccineum]
MASNEETNAAGTDTRPPMLVESDYDSWKIRIHRYIRGKPNGKLIWNSIQNGPTPHPMITDPPPTGSTIVPAPRKKLDSEFNDEENKLEMADTQAEIILSQGLPRHIFNILNQTSTDSCGGGGDLWKQCRTTYMQDREEHYQQRKKNQFDEIRMKITQLEIPTHQMNTKFCQQSSAYLGSILTSKPTSLMPKRSSQETGAIYKYVDPLALCSHHHILQLLFIIPQTPSPQPTAQSPNDALMATMTQIANLLSGFQKQFPPNNNQL